MLTEEVSQDSIGASMFLQVPYRQSLDFFGQKITLETGLLAQQATATVVASAGQTTVMAAVVVGKEMDTDFLPLQVIYEERLYAAGKIKGSRFIKREGKPTDNAVLTGRLVDRSLRSLFHDGIRNDIQIVITVLSLDEINPPDTLAVLAASAALSSARIDGFNGPTSCVRVGLSADKSHLIVNPTYEQMKSSQLDLVIAGNGTNIVMLEAGATIVEEEYIIHAMEASMPALAQLTNFQSGFISLVPHEITSTSKTQLDENSHNVVNLIASQVEDAMYSSLPKLEKYAQIDQVKSALFDAVGAYIADSPPTLAESLTKTIYNMLPNVLPQKPQDTNLFIKSLEEAFHLLQKKLVERNILNRERRLDGRRLDEVRPLTIQVDVLPRVHGSALFQRGETQVLNVLTLGTLRDAQTLDDMEDFEETTKRYLHHYNFPQYSVGETGRYGGPGRREIGHGALAEKALVPVLPSEDDFPYTMRLVSECLGSNGSTSMASTCASTLSLMAGGVPIRDMVAGIAMGVVVGDNGRYTILTDIQGAEDHLGDMDFKVTGTKNGVTAIQLDNKISGLTIEILSKALQQSKTARLHILSEMQKVLAVPKPEISPSAPKVTKVQIPFEKIGDVIGPQGKIIKSIIADTHTEIDIEDETGKTYIYAKNSADAEAALARIQGLIRDFQVGDHVQGTVFRIENYGAFVKLEGGKEGMIHISRMSTERVEKVEDKVKMNDIVSAYVAEINEKDQIALSLVPLDQLSAKPHRAHGNSGDRGHFRNHHRNS